VNSLQNAGASSKLLKRLGYPAEYSKLVEQLGDRVGTHYASVVCMDGTLASDNAFALAAHIYELFGDRVILTCSQCPSNDVATVHIEDDVHAVDDSLAWSLELRDIPCSHCTRTGCHQLRLAVHRMHCHTATFMDHLIGR